MFLLVLIAWVFFRASSISDAIYIITHVPATSDFVIADLWTLGLPRFEMLLALLMIGMLFCVELAVSREWSALQWIWATPALRRACYCSCIYCIVFFGVFEKVKFIYFQF
ncbi:unnamed protein product [marine sediment metagenome]|uniref:Uncharacterized protein n=1 Tax=marine sediment metagenome TaxID=412755 RepID=X0W7V9_9ZZZZ